MTETVDSTRRTLRSTLVAHGVVVACMLALSAWGGWWLPDDVRIANHWNVFRLDPSASKLEGLLVPPLLGVGIGVAFAVAPFVDPRRQNLMRSLGAYQLAWLAVVSVLAVSHFAAIGNALGWAIDPTKALLLMIAISFVIGGNVMGKLRSNHSLGVRTPWTLASDAVWNKTHRVIGWALVLLGVSVGFATFVFGDPDAAMYVIGVGGLTVAVLKRVISYGLWAKTKERQHHE